MQPTPIARCLAAIAKSRELKIAGIVRRPELIRKIETTLGVDFVGVESPELSKQIQVATGGMPIRLGLDAVGGPATATMASVLSPGAHLVSYAQLSGLPIHVPQADLIGKRLNIHGLWMYYKRVSPKIRAALTEATEGGSCGGGCDAQPPKTRAARKPPVADLQPNCMLCIASVRRLGER